MMISEKECQSSSNGPIPRFMLVLAHASAVVQEGTVETRRHQNEESMLQHHETGHRTPR